MSSAFDSLTGLAVGDAFGAQFFPVENGRPPAEGSIALPPGPWPWSDDTEMACSVFDVLHRHGRVDPDSLAAAFADRFDPRRKYGRVAKGVLGAMREGVPWRTAAARPFDGQGSMGNGAAMRVAPLGAYYAGDLGRAAQEAAASAVVTHAHPEGAAGAVAVAVAAAYAVDGERDGFLRAVLSRTPPGAVRDGVLRASELPGRAPEEAAAELGNGARELAHDTVPFCLWVAAVHLDDYERALRACVAVGGDVDTTAAIVGGIVAARTGAAAIPPAWRAASEPLPGWLPVSGRDR